MWLSATSHGIAVNNLGLDKIIDLSGKFSIGEIGSLIVFILLLLYLARVCIKGGKKSE